MALEAPLSITLGLVCLLGGPTAVRGDEGKAPPDGRPLLLDARGRVEDPKGSGRFRAMSRRLEWRPKETAIIICDMWDVHWCQGATRRVAEMAPVMNEIVSKAREMGVLIVHAPSDTMKTYEGHPARLRAQKAPRAPDIPQGVAAGCGELPSEKKGRWPVDQSDGGCDCEPQCKVQYPWRSQIAAIEIRDTDAISDSGTEIWSLFADRGIRNVILMGVHTNMCVIGRPFGLRNMARFGKNVVLARDLTDTMYNSRKWPNVPHFTGTDLVVEHIEKYVCPTITSAVLSGTDAFRSKEDTRPRVVFLSGEDEYGAAFTLPELARLLQLHGGLAAEVCQASTESEGLERHRIPGIEALRAADLAVLFARRRALPAEDLRLFKEYLARGKPLVAFRTSSHGFSVRGDIPQGCEDWKDFDREVLGCRYDGYPHGETLVSVVPTASEHPIVKGLSGPYQLRETLYRSLPLAPSCHVLLVGKCVDGVGDNPRYRRALGEDTPEQPVAWVNTYRGARVFYTSLGSAEASFPQGWFRRMAAGAVFWALGRPPPDGFLEKAESAWGSVGASVD